MQSYPLLYPMFWAYTYYYLKAGNFNPPYHHPMITENMLIAQDDLQLVTGIFIILASLVTIYRDDETPLYHISLYHQISA